MGFFKKKKPPEPKDVKVLAYKNYKPGVPKPWRVHSTDTNEAKRYG